MTAPADERAPRVVLTTVPDATVADRVARALVERRLAACVQVLPAIVSIYRWQGAIERADEAMLAIKTVAGRIREIEAAFAAEHPYEVPEFVVLEPRHVGAAYAAWLAEECRAVERG
jgi:periplasmic divalent cation tolerance protein